MNFFATQNFCEFTLVIWQRRIFNFAQNVSFETLALSKIQVAEKFFNFHTVVWSKNLLSKQQQFYIWFA